MSSEALREDLRKMVGSLDRRGRPPPSLRACARRPLERTRPGEEPLSYTNAPIGLNFLIAGYGYLWGDVLVDPSLPIKDADAKVHTVILDLRADLGLRASGTFAMIVPYARLSGTGEVAANHGPSTGPG